MEKDNVKSKEKLTKEEKAERRRNDHIAREKDRERKRAKRLNPAYRMMEQERDRERKKMLRNDVTFRSLEKIRDRMRKERKRCYGELENSNNAEEMNIMEEPLLEPEVILSTPEYPQQYQQDYDPLQYNSNRPNESPNAEHF